MKKNKIIILFTSMLIVTSAIISNDIYSQSTELFWWDIDKAENYVNKYEDPAIPENKHIENKKKLDIALSKEKILKLKKGNFPEDIKKTGPFNLISFLKRSGDPLKKLEGLEPGKSLEVKLPTNKQDYGLYQLGSIIQYKTPDTEAVTIFYPKAIFSHYQNGNPERIDTPDILFKEKDGLEITPDSASRYIGSIQISHREYQMQVTYRGKPLPGCHITVITEEKWKKELKTDKNGKFIITPLEARKKRLNFEKYLYVAKHKDKDKLHIATLQMIVDPPWPEYRSYEGILLAWAINITGIIILIALIRFFIKKKRDTKNKTIFKNHEIRNNK